MATVGVNGLTDVRIMTSRCCRR